MNKIDNELYKNIGLQLKKAREAKKMSLDTLCERIGQIKTKSTLKRYEDGESRIELDILQLICEKLDVNYKEIIDIAKKNISNESITQIGKIVFDDYFPLHYSTNLSAGTLEELLDSDPDAVVYVPIKFQNMKKRLHAFKVNGTSMNNVIEDGSIVITEDINHLNSIKDGTIVVAFIDGQATVKRFYLNDKSITLMPDSTDKSHMPIMFNTEDKQISIIGRVIWHMNPDDIEKFY